MTTIEEIFSELPYELDRTTFSAPSFDRYDGREYKVIMDQFQWMIYDKPTLESVHVYNKDTKRFSEDETAKCFNIVALKEPLLVSLDYTKFDYDDSLDDTVDNATVEDKVHYFFISGTVYQVLCTIHKEYIRVSGDTEPSSLFFEGINSYGRVIFGT